MLIIIEDAISLAVDLTGNIWVNRVFSTTISNFENLLYMMCVKSDTCTVHTATWFIVFEHIKNQMQLSVGFAAGNFATIYIFDCTVATDTFGSPTRNDCLLWNADSETTVHWCTVMWFSVTHWKNPIILSTVIILHDLYSCLHWKK